MKKVVFVFLILLTFSAEAQVPGFKGKRWVFSYNPHFFSRILYSDQQGLVDYLKPHFRHNLEVGKVQSRSLVIGGFADYIRLANMVHYSYGSIDQPVTGFSTGVFFYFYNYRGKGAIAPLGNYGKLNLGLTWYNAGSRLYEEPEEKNLAPIVMYSIGKKNIFMEKILTDFGIQFGLLLPSLQKPTDAGFHDSARSSLWGYYLFNFYLGIGLVPF